jgi:hypothetical protein
MTLHAPEIAPLPPLLESCRTCRGTGTVQAVPWQEWWLKHVDGVLPDEQEAALMGPEMLPCAACGGRGDIPTAAGCEIARLLAWLGRGI